MNYELKKALNGFIDCLVTGVSKFQSDSDAELEDVALGFKLDFAIFMMYLSASDGEISFTEANTINYYFDLNLNPQQIKKYIIEKNIYSEEFEQTPPNILKTTVALEEMAKLLHIDLDGLSDVLIKCYEAIGRELIRSDNTVTDEETKDFYIYIDMLKNYALKQRGDSGNAKIDIKKKSNEKKSSIKNGVSAPKKA